MLLKQTNTLIDSNIELKLKQFVVGNVPIIIPLTNTQFSIVKYVKFTVRIKNHITKQLLS